LYIYYLLNKGETQLNMYLNYYGLKENPFNVTSDPSFFYLSKAHREALAHLLYGIRERKGFLELTGEVGAGKTTLCKTLLKRLDPNTKTAFILNSNLSENQKCQRGPHIGRSAKS
jgi:general secretion pathway protein A